MTHTDHFKQIAEELGLQGRFVSATIELLDGGATVPFISRYRKEQTGSLDEVAVTNIRDRVAQLRELDKRKEAIIKSLKEQEKLTDELEQQVMDADTMARLEDIYLPYRPKRKTRATAAKEKGLQPLADWLFEQKGGDVTGEAAKYIDEEKGVANADEALQGARDIIAERINEDAQAREAMRKLFFEKGTFKAAVIPGKEEDGKKFKDYFDWEEPVAKAPSHRVLAMRRAEKEMVVSLDTAPPDEDASFLLNNQFVTAQGPTSEQIELAVKDGYRRLMKPSLETEVRLQTKKKADEEAIKVFSKNMRELLLSAPLGQKRVLGVDPGFRTGCKVVCLDAQGALLHYEAIFPNAPQKRTMEAGATIKHLCERFNIEAIAVGNGTASRETEQFIKQLGLPKSIIIIMVNESGASIYSASEVARDEFPDHDVTVRGAVSIGRRLMDPLAELVKIDPKSIGVGQYQHDVDQTALKLSLDDTVMSCVNAVGVEVNTASKELLTYVSGLGPQLAKNIVDYRNENGPFATRNELLKVSRLGAKAYEQAAGFLRIRNGKNPLDSSAVHPERYAIVEQMANDLGCKVNDLVAKESLHKQIPLQKYVSDEVGLPTLKDIVAELAKPGRDPREQFEAFAYEESVNEIADLKVGMQLPGIVTNVTNFGAFVDVGVHQDGLVHISHLADRYVSNPADVVTVQQKVTVTVLEVDEPRKRISLSMKADPFAAEQPKKGPRKKRGGQQGRPDNMEDKLNQLRNKFGK